MYAVAVSFKSYTNVIILNLDLKCVCVLVKLVSKRKELKRQTNANEDIFKLNQNILSHVVVKSFDIKTRFTNKNLITRPNPKRPEAYPQIDKHV